MGKGNKLLGSMFWSFAQTYSSQLIGIVVTTILARLVLPKEYGIIAAAQVFVSFATTFAAGGSFSNALIQKKDADQKDFSTMFFFNVVFSLVVYILVFISAPMLVRIFNDSYDYDQLVKVVRVLGIGVFLTSFNAFFNALHQKRLNFKVLFKISFIAIIPSAVVGIFMAYKGFGVWALVAQTIVSKLVISVLLIVTVKWKPSLYFSFSRFKPMFKYGYKMMLAGLTITLYADLTSIVIGRRYSSESLAFYNKGTAYPKLIVLNGTTAMCSAMFPVLSQMRDKAEIKELIRRFNRISAFVITPAMFGFAVVGPAFVRIILGERWMPAVIFLQICCMNYAVQPIALSSLQYLKAAGKAGEYLVLDLIRKAISVILLFVAIFFNKGIELIALSELISNTLAIIVNIRPGKKYLDYSIREQIGDVLPKFLCSGLMSVVVYLVSLVAMPLGVSFCLQILTGIISYIVLAKLFRMKELGDVWSFVKQKLSRKSQNKEQV